MLSGEQRRQKKPELQRRASDESNSSSTTTSPSKTHRRTSSFNGWTSISPDGSDSDVSVKSSTTKARDPLNAYWSSSGSGNLSRVDMMNYSPESPESMSRCKNGDNKSVCALELIRQLSFSPLGKNSKKGMDKDNTASSSSSSPKKQNTSPIGFDLKYVLDSPPSPLVGLQYLPDGDMFMI
jgi:hypothetical protein